MKRDRICRIGFKVPITIFRIGAMGNSLGLMMPILLWRDQDPRAMAPLNLYALPPFPAGKHP